MINFEEISFKMIQKIGEAKYIATTAFEKAKNKEFKNAYKLIDEANVLINKASSLHMDIIQIEAEGKEVKFSVLFMHAEDQLLTTQTFILSTKMMIDVIKLNEK